MSGSFHNTASFILSWFLLTRR